MSRAARVNAIIDSLGGTAEASRLFGVSMAVVSAWRAAGKFPARLYLRHNAILAERGITSPPALWGLEPREAAE
jgi:ethanolamine ammonia-lyase large subunit